ncbi:PD-(D/E)XK nuclease family protein [uncultured Capnocytophaga sp.]|uniref:PD-(D/E)XK nuclease family protein n=1 Tax=uncultured Capnocytophaga sp. TaxID=159273 RepID=UPI0026391B94|nr:PD-(D/E)XK nuclease family protein [uncultured Capnocytophaga sp.]
MEVQTLLTTFRKTITEWKEKEEKGEGFNFISFISRIWGIGETKHSQILGFFLNPRENHGQGGLFLKLFLKKLGFDITAFEPNDWTVEVEQRSNGRDQIDILVQSRRLGISIAIENKSNGAKDQSHQLYRYWESAIYNFHNRDKEKALNPKHSRVVYLPQFGIPSEQTRTRPKDYKESYPEKLALEEQGGIISCWTYYNHIVKWLNSCVEAMGRENNIVKQLVKNYIEYWNSTNSKNTYYMNALEEELKTKENWLIMGEAVNTMNNLRTRWAEDFSNQLASIECHSDFAYNKDCDEADYYNDFRWTYGGTWGDIAFIYEPHKGLSIWKAGAGKARERYKERLEHIFPDFMISQDSNSNYLMHLKDQNDILLCNSEDKEEVFLWEYHNKGEQVRKFITEKIRKYTNDQEVRNLLKEINDWKFEKELQNIVVGENFKVEKYNTYIDFRWGLKNSDLDKDLVFLYYPYNKKGFCLWKRNFGNKKEQYKSLFAESFSEDFEWFEDNTVYIMRLKGNAFSAIGNEEEGFSKYEAVEKLTKILQKYTNKPEIVALFKKINEASEQ